MIQRYSTEQMSKIWSDQNRFNTWKIVELAVVKVMADKGIIPEKSSQIIKGILVFELLPDIECQKTKKIYDEFGINMVGNGIGHDIVAILDNNTAEPIILNDYFEAELNSYQKGSIQYPFKELEEGKHTLTLKVWDVYNNSSTADIQFIVTGNDELEITRVLNYPNPFVNYTEFWFNHNRPFEPLEVQVQERL